jgi:homoserine dehydrogenase
VKALKVGICGLGVVGGGVFVLLNRNADLVQRRIGAPVEVSLVAMRSNKLGLALGDTPVTDDVFEVARSPDVDVVVETIGGTDLALTLVRESLQQGKHVVTANKALIAEHGNALVALAEEKGVTLAYEAAVAGGTPVIKAIREGLAGNRISGIAGIINGTGNYILTQMRDTGAPFEKILKDAQALGYAEADPTFDVEGIDAAHKLTIMASIAFGMPLAFDQVYTQGISLVAPQDIEFAKELGYEVKHLGIAALAAPGRVSLRVHPVLVPKKCLLAGVNGVMNAVLVSADAVGSSMYYGPGAGSEATGSAIVSDIVDIARGNHVPVLGFTDSLTSSVAVDAIDQAVCGHYLRMVVDDRPGVIAEITRVMGDAGLSIDALVQKEHESGEKATLVVLIHDAPDAQARQSIQAIESLPTVSHPVQHIRVEHFS